MAVDAVGLDGRKVRFVVEEQHAGKWDVQGKVEAEVKGGIARASLAVKHPATANAAAPPRPAPLRFRTELV